MSAPATTPPRAPERDAQRPPPSHPAPPGTRSSWVRWLAPLSSLRLTVVLLGLGILVTFFGTLAQTEDGLYIAQQKYFRSWASVWSPHDPAWKWLRIPLPGGYLLGTLLVLNLLAAHTTRFKPTWRKSGIFLTHLGVMMLLLGQLATDLFSRESRMSFPEGEWRNYSEDFQKTELVFLGDTQDPSMDLVISIPDSVLARGGEIRHPQLPFTVRVREFAENASIRSRAPMVDTNRPPAATQGVGTKAVFSPAPPVRTMNDRNLPGTVVELADANGASLGTWLFGLVLNEQPVESGGRTWRVALRPTRYYQPFSVKLLKTTHEVYTGTRTASDPRGIPRNFASRVQLERPATGEKREVDISMNEPLRYGGLTFYQHQMDREEMTRGGRGISVLQVVRNPSWIAPYFGTVFVLAGLIIQFLIHLVGFLRKRTA
ncbi:MAG: cytochrome c biogenesis protein ResB [Verrucomicrobiales bacterium]|nr:cytochrome c biogenesis protein ResB [Verrucomicrobiales bacterium]